MEVKDVLVDLTLSIKVVTLDVNWLIFKLKEYLWIGWNKINHMLFIRDTFKVYLL